MVSEPVGRREQAKRATRDAIRAASQELFARQGFEATTVRQIAESAGVTERTFYRYFDGKEGLLAEQAVAWMLGLCDAIRARDAAEPALSAVQDAMLDAARLLTDDLGRGPIWLFTGQPRAFEVLQRSAPRPLLRIEREIAQALLARPGARADEATRAEAGLIARVSVAVLRTAAIRRHEGGETPSELRPLLVEAFASLRHLAGEAGEGD